MTHCRISATGWGRACLGALIGMVLSGCAMQAEKDAMAWYDGERQAPRGDRIYICHGFGCTYRTPVDFSRRDLARLKTILAQGRKSPEAERRAVAEAVAWQERRVASTVGSAGDVGGFDMHNGGVRGQMDCLDESTNTNSLLVVAEAHGLLRHHKVASPVARGFFLDGRYPHATATLRETTSGKVFAIDSWPRPNGELPVVQALEAWMASRPASG
ncbi:hypothetical protein [Roseibium aestuarii]|uniref:Uncharacterized protein n=1 Tax=Roseibium aestuarii TaxID=2600299 RepID=A0ABW4JSH0_9HYPH|nr:hypothetical protein [Roseibium aestuarii]